MPLTIEPRALHMLSAGSTTELYPIPPHRSLPVVFVTLLRMFGTHGVLRGWGKNSRPGSPDDRKFPSNHGGEAGVGFLAGSHSENQGKAGQADSFIQTVYIAV